MATLSASEPALVFPVKSVCLTVKMCTPSARLELVAVQLPARSAIASPTSVAPSYSFTVAKGSAPVPLNVGVASLVRLSVCDAPESDAAIKSGALGGEAVLSVESMTLTAPTYTSSFSVI